MGLEQVIKVALQLLEGKKSFMELGQETTLRRPNGFQKNELRETNSMQHSACPKVPPPGSCCIQEHDFFFFGGGGKGGGGSGGIRSMIFVKKFGTFIHAFVTQKTYVCAENMILHIYLGRDM